MATPMPETGRTTVVFNLGDAADALARSDEGANPLPGDQALIDAYDLFLQQEQERYEWARYEDERRQQIAEAAAAHADDCYGDGCDHWTHEEA